MVELRRTVRLSINPGASDADVAVGCNGFSAVPAMRGLGRHYELDVVCRGEPDSESGYLVNIKTIDKAVRGSALPVLVRACRDEPERDPATLLAPMRDAIAGGLPCELRSLVLRLSPYYSVAMDTATDRFTLRQRFDFAAAHRLHVAGWSDDENKSAFGKCNNPSGHGHNYQVEPAVAVGFDDAGMALLTLEELETIVDESLIDPFDHTHLNVDTHEFGADGVNPSVENIAKVFYGRLAKSLEGRDGVELRSVTVWETDRTSCTYPDA
ncbi:MAG: 6-carboxytetrahydropterin synthase [Planctomycetota bacterium]